VITPLLIWGSFWHGAGKNGSIAERLQGARFSASRQSDHTFIVRRV